MLNGWETALFLAQRILSSAMVRGSMQGLSP